MSPKKLRGPTASSKKARHGIYYLEDVQDRLIDRTGFIVYVCGDPYHPGVGEDGLEEPGVEYRMANRFEQNLRILSSIDSTRPIQVVLSSVGGDWKAGMQMFSAIATCPNPVVVTAVNDARSMTSLIPLAADLFLIRPPAMYMIHRGQWGMLGLDQEADTCDIQRRIANKQMLMMYVARLKEQGILKSKSENDIEQAIQNRFQSEIDVWFTADEAARFGFADGVFTGDLEMIRSVNRNEERRAKMLGILRAHVSVSVSVKVRPFKSPQSRK